MCLVLQTQLEKSMQQHPTIDAVPSSANLVREINPAESKLHRCCPVLQIQLVDKYCSILRPQRGAACDHMLYYSTKLEIMYKLRACRAQKIKQSCAAPANYSIQWRWRSSGFDQYQLLSPAACQIDSCLSRLNRCRLLLLILECNYRLASDRPAASPSEFHDLILHQLLLHTSLHDPAITPECHSAVQVLISISIYSHQQWDICCFN